MVFESKKKREPVIEEENVEVSPDIKPTPIYTHVSFGIYKNLNDGLWYVSKMQYNPVTGEAGNFSSKSTNSTFKAEAEDQFKMAVADNLFDG